MRTVFLGLTLAAQVGWKTIQKLILSGLDEHCFQLSPTQWKTDFPFLTGTQAEQLSDWLQRDRLKEYERQLKKEGMLYFTVVDDAYPPLLKEIDAPPWLLFAKGKLSLLNRPALAVVGSRKTSPYGRMTTRNLVSALAARGWCIVSGLAVGVDGLAHETALRAEGATIAVLGSGINVVYPRGHRHYYQQISEKGLLLSEYAPNTPAHPGFFPQRNRIIAGLAYGTLVIEAAKKSGSLITAHHALEYGREVFAVPGSIYDAQSVGTNLLIQQQGAKLITNVDDILAELTHVSFPQRATRSQVSPTDEMHLDDEERKILQLLKQKKMHINELRSQTALEFNRLSKILLTLEMKQYIQSLPGSYYQNKQMTKNNG